MSKFCTKISKLFFFSSFIYRNSSSFVALNIVHDFRFECIFMSSGRAERSKMTRTAHGSDLEGQKTKGQALVPTPPRPPHRRPQKIFSSERLPSLFAWTLLLSTSSSYWICIYPELFELLPSLSPIFILHLFAFFLLCANFFLATFVDPVSDEKRSLLVRRQNFLGDLSAILDQ